MTVLHAAFLVAGVVAALLGLVWAAVSDVARYDIPHRACGLVGAGYILAAVGGPIGPWLSGLIIGALVFAVGLALFAKGWLGGGDVKLLAVVVPWAGPTHLTEFALISAAGALLMAAALASPLKRRLPSPPEGVLDDFRRPMPFGAPLAAGGAWVTLLHLSSLR
jgi:prepilin peptidase CpaA